MTLPNLIGCGAGKSGTTSLYHYLNQHPDIFMAKDKETHYFSHHYGKGENWYKAKFEGHGHEKVIGEFSTSYMMDPAVPERIHRMLPGVKLMFIFRNPIERAYSNYWFSISIGTQSKRESFSSAIRSSAGFKKYVASGFYDCYLQDYLKFHNADKIHVTITEELRADPLKQMSICYQFLEIEPTFEPGVERSYNVTVAPTAGWKLALFRSWTDTKKRLKLSLFWLPHFMRRELSFFERQLAKTLLGTKNRPTMLESDRAYLTEVYEAHTQGLSQLIGRELKYWD